MVSDCEGEYYHDSRKNMLEWKLPLIDDSNKTGSMEFSINGHPDDFFPVHVSFVSKKSYCEIEVRIRFLYWHYHVLLGHPKIKVCFLSSGWPKLWPVGRPQNLFFFPFFFFLERNLSNFLGKKIPPKMSPVAKKIPTRPVDRKQPFF